MPRTLQIKAYRLVGQSSPSIRQWHWIKCSFLPTTSQLQHLLLIRLKALTYLFQDPSDTSNYQYLQMTVPSTCCGRSGEACVCASQAKCSCGKQSAMNCNCEKANTENTVTGARCSCRESTLSFSHFLFSGLLPFLAHTSSTLQEYTNLPMLQARVLLVHALVIELPLRMLKSRDRLVLAEHVQQV